MSSQRYPQIKYNTYINYAYLLGLIFIVLKLTNVINWSWWWVLAPFWIPISIVLGIFLIGILLILVFI